MITRHELTYQIRYAIRLTQRTARLYRRIQTAGAVILTLAGGVLIAVRPADKAAQNEADARRYLALAAKAAALSDEALAAALEEAHQSDCQEVEPLRDIAYNDIVMEYGRADTAVPLSRLQNILAAMA